MTRKEMQNDKRETGRNPGGTQAVAGRKNREIEFARWPKYKNLFLWSFGKMLEERKRRGNMTGSQNEWTTAEDVFRWWMEYDVLPGQMGMEDFMETEEE